MPLKYPRLLTISAFLIIAGTGAAQTAPPPDASASNTTATATPPPTTDAAAPARPRRAANGAGGTDAAPADWPRPADGPPILTEDFESGVLDPKKMTVRIIGDATATIVQDNVAHGKNSLHVHYPAGARGAIAFIALSLPQTLRDHFYGRAYVFITAMPSGHCVLMTSGSFGYPISNFLEIGLRQNHFQPSFQQNGPNVPRFEDHPLQGTPPIGHWFCLEWEFNDKPDRIVMWIDGKLSVNQTFAMNGVKSGLTGGFFEYDVGFRSWSAPAKDVDIYYDDIAIGDKPIGQLTPVPAPSSGPAK